MINTYNVEDIKSIKAAERKKSMLENAGYTFKGTKINTITGNVVDTYTIKGTTYDHWNEGRVSGFGSFHTALLEAYKLASESNRKPLQGAFPEWFVKESEM